MGISLAVQVLVTTHHQLDTPARLERANWLEYGLMLRGLGQSMGMGVQPHSDMFGLVICILCLHRMEIIDMDSAVFHGGGVYYMGFR